MRITVLCGISGVGKTHYREHNLPDVPYLDIADIYDEIYLHEPLVTRSAIISMAHATLAERIWEAANKGIPHLVVEGYFLPGSPSRDKLSGVARVLGADIEFILLEAPVDECQRRILAQWDALTQEERDDPTVRRRYRARIQLLKKFRQ